MLSLLESKHQMLLRILVVFITEGDWLTVNQLSEKLGLKNRTISNYLKFLKDNYPEIGLETSYSKGTRLNDLSGESFKDIKLKIASESVSVQLISSIYYNPHDHLENHMSRVGVGRTTIYRRINELNERLEEYDLSIKLKSNQLYLESSNELSLRYFCTYFISELKGFHLEKVSPDYKFTKKRIEKIFNEEDLFMSIHNKFYNAFYAISIFREQQGFCLKNELIDAPYSFEEEEIIYIKNKIDNVSVSKIIEIENSLLKINYRLSEENKKSINGKIKKRIKLIGSELNLTFSTKQMEKLQIYFESVYLINKNFKSLSQDLDGPIALFALSLKNTNKRVYCIIEDNIKRMAIEQDIDLTNMIYSIVTFIAVVAPEILEQRYELNLLVVSNLNKQHSLFLYNYIKNKLILNLDEINTVSCISAQELSHYNMKDYDVVITNSLNVHRSVSSALVDDFPTMKNLVDLKNVFEEKRLSKIC